MEKYSGSGPLTIRETTVDDIPLILEFVRALAAYERLTHEIQATEETLRESLFGSRPAAEVVLAFHDDQPVGFAVFFQNFSTFVGKPGLYLEDLFIKPEFRNRGYGKILFRHVARIANQRGAGRFEWAALDWNEPATAFYKKLGARPLDDWTVFRLTGEPLRKFGT